MERQRGTGCGATDRDQRNVDCLLTSLSGDMFAILEILFQTATLKKIHHLAGVELSTSPQVRIQVNIRAD